MDGAEMSATEIRKFMDLMESVQIGPVPAALVVDFILDNCKPWLQKNPKLIPLYRGAKGKNTDGSLYPAVVVPVRTDRKPLDTDVYYHDFVNDYFKKIGSPVTRGNSVFASGNITYASHYGTVYLMFPIGEFDFMWSPEIDDFTDGPVDEWDKKIRDRAATKIKRDRESNGIESSISLYSAAREFLDTPEGEEFAQALLKKVSVDDLETYQVNQNLEEAINSDNEVMIRYGHVLLVDKIWANRSDLEGKILEGLK